jgi:hypothetical protein
MLSLRLLSGDAGDIEAGLQHLHHGLDLQHGRPSRMASRLFASSFPAVGNAGRGADVIVGCMRGAGRATPPSRPDARLQ